MTYGSIEIEIVMNHICYWEIVDTIDDVIITCIRYSHTNISDNDESSWN